MANQDPIKIALVGYRLSFGGAERVLSNTSFILEKLGYEVHIITMIDDIGYPFAGKLFNLGATRNKSNSFINKIRRFYALKKYIQNQGIEIIIDFRFRVNTLQELLIYKLAYRVPIVVQTVHSGNYSNYLFKNKFLSQIVFRGIDRVVCISTEQMKRIQRDLGFNNTILIHNSIDMDHIGKLAKDSFHYPKEYLVAVGRYDAIKQFDQLIQAYQKSSLPSKDIHLLIVGDGPEKENLQHLITDNKLENFVKLIPFDCNPYKIMHRSLALVQSSLSEGFPMVLIEALACKKAVIAFDCPTGPSEIIEDQVNGILVEDQNFASLISAMEKICMEEDFRKYCESNTISSVEKYDLNNISKQWETLLNQLTNNKRVR